MENKIMTGYRVCDVMTRKPVSVAPSATVAECAKLMTEKGIGSLAVREGNTLKGYITEQVLVREVLARKLDGTEVKAADVMAKRVETIGPEKDLMDAVRKMRELDVRQLPVIDAENGNKLVGLLTLNDIVKIQPQAFEVLSERMGLEDERRRSETARLEGTCDTCGAFSETLYEQESSFVCAACHDADQKGHEF